MHEDDKKLANALRGRLFWTRFSSIINALLILSVPFGISLAFSITAAKLGGIFYFFLIFIPVLVPFSMVAVYYKLKLTWTKKSTIRVVLLISAALSLVDVLLFLLI